MDLRSGGATNAKWKSDKDELVDLVRRQSIQVQALDMGNAVVGDHVGVNRQRRAIDGEWPLLDRFGVRPHGGNLELGQVTRAIQIWARSKVGEARIVRSPVFGEAGIDEHGRTFADLYALSFGTVSDIRSGD